VNEGNSKRLVRLESFVLTLQVLQGSVPETMLAQDGGGFHALFASGWILAAGQLVPDVGVGDEDDHAGVRQWNQGSLHGPERMSKKIS
jgi:hypothetical protein